MTQRNDGGPAFPGVEHALDPRTTGFMGYSGMTLRDYFAAKAMQGLLSGQYAGTDSSQYNFTEVITEAYGIADAMLVEKEK